MPPKTREKEGATARENKVKKEDDLLMEAKRKQLQLCLAEFDAKYESYISSIKNDLSTSCRNIQAFYDLQLLAISATKTQKSFAPISESRSMTDMKTTCHALVQMQENVTPTSKKHGFPSNITPCRKKSLVNATSSITPKFDPRKPLLPSALRRPKVGEIFMSLSGSPLLNTAGTDSKSGIVLHLGGGKVIDMSDISHLNDIGVDFVPTKCTLQLVNRKLAKIFASTEAE